MELARDPLNPAQRTVDEETERRLIDGLRRDESESLAAIWVLAVVGIGVWNLSLQGNEDGFVAGSAQQGGSRLRIVYIPDEKVARLRLDLPGLATDRAYQARQLTPGGPISLGLVPNRGATAIATDLSGASGSAIIEPAGGSAAPTTTPLLIAEL